MKLLAAGYVLLLFGAAVVLVSVDCKRGGGSRGGGGTRSKSGTGWGLFNRKSSKKGSSSGSPPAAAPAPAPIPAHEAGGFKKQAAPSQHQSPSNGGQQKPPPSPYGWNVPNSHQVASPGLGGATGGTGGGIWKPAAHGQSPGYNNHQQRHQMSHVAGSHAQGPPPSYQQSLGHQPYPGQGGYHQAGYSAPGSYGGYHGGYGGYQGGYGGYQGGYGGYQGGYGGYQGGYHGGYGGGYGGGGMGMGGFGGGWGGGGYGGGYMQQKKRGFFSGGSTFGNILTGMMIYHLTSSLIGGMFRHKPYNVYNYYNMPPEAKQEIKMPSNVLTLCEGNATNFCAQGTTSICTTNGTVLCVATMTNAVPCAEEKTLCVNATMSCPDKNDPLCQNLTKGEDKATLPVPCLTNLTVDVNLLNETSNNGNADYKYCVTQLAVAGPEYRNCTEKDLVGTTLDYRNVIAGMYSWNLTVWGMVHPYAVFNYDRPMASAGSVGGGDIVMPLDMVIPCVENATKVCAPPLVPICTAYKEVMCLETLTETKYCERFNTTCVRSVLPCDAADHLQDTNSPWCSNRTEEEMFEKDGKKHVAVQIPCFANITVNSNLPSFQIHEFNGTLPEGQNSSYTYHYRYCVGTLAIPGPESEACLQVDPAAPVLQTSS